MKKITMFFLKVILWITTGEKVLDQYACQYILSTVHFNQKETKVIVDLSAYDEYKIAQYIVYLKRPPITPDEQQVNGITVVIPQVLLLRVKRKKQIYWDLKIIDGGPHEYNQ